MMRQSYGLLEEALDLRNYIILLTLVLGVVNFFTWATRSPSSLSG